jgi:hypothetical protein
VKSPPRQNFLKFTTENVFDWPGNMQQRWENFIRPLNLAQGWPPFYCLYIPKRLNVALTIMSMFVITDKLCMKNRFFSDN